MMKNKKKMLSLLISIIMLVSFNVVVYGATFPDLKDPGWEWAKSIVEDMSEKGIIAGFPDGTFKPAESVTKLQALILLSRISGVDEKENNDYVELAEEIYGDELKFFDIANKKEVSYLLYKDIINKDELNTYISKDNYDTKLKRYEAAILLTKIMGQEQTVKNKITTFISFEDVDLIPSYAKPYVEYVNKEDIMKGMSETEFGPMVDVSRAQMAVMLSRSIEANEKIDKQISGIIIEKNIEKSTIKIQDIADSIKEYKIDSQVILRQNGEMIKFDDLIVGSKTMITLKSDKPYMLETISPEMDSNISGPITTLYLQATIKKIRIEIEQDAKPQTKEYTIDDDVVVIYNEKASKLESLTTGDYAKLYIRNGKVKKIEAESKTKNVSGIVEDIIFAPVFKLKIKHTDGIMQEYEVTDNISVIKNRRNSDLRSVEIDDDVDLTLEYYKIRKISATSESSSSMGIIEEIIISKAPSIKIKEDDKEKIYNIKRDAVIKVDDKEATIYDLRLGYSVQFTIDGSTITNLETKASLHSQQITGTVESVNESYGFINLTSTDGTTGNLAQQQIFISKMAKIIRSKDTRTMRIGEIKQGDIITAIGSTNTGIFEANTIIIISN